MDRLLLLLVALCLGFLGQIQASDQPEYCQNKICPEYNVVESNGDFEERQYLASKWMKTQVTGTGISDIKAASDRLTAFTKEQKVESSNAWPVLITVQQAVSGDVHWMSWLVPPGVDISDGKDGVEVVTLPETNVYVRSFGGTPSLEGGQQNAEQLRKDLEKAGKGFDHSVFHAAGYESYFSTAHHNEIWILKA